MPPKPKYTKEEIVRSALELIEEEGASALTARALGAKLGCSSCPIFTVFRDMNELKEAVLAEARECFIGYMRAAESFCPAYKKRGMQWVRFSKEHPRLFQLLFMSETKGEKDFDRALQVIPFGKEDDIAIIIRDYHANEEQAERLFRQMWIYTYGLCTLSATGVCSFSEEEIATALGEAFRGAIFVLQSGKTIQTDLQPTEANSGEGERLRRQHPDLREA